MGPADGSQIIMVDQAKKPVVGIVREAPMAIADARVPINLLVIDTEASSLLLGTDWLRRYAAEISFQQQRLTFENKGQRLATPIQYNKVTFASPNHHPDEYEVNMTSVKEVQQQLKGAKYTSEECKAFLKIAKEMGLLSDRTETTQEEEEEAANDLSWETEGPWEEDETKPNKGTVFDRVPIRSYTVNGLRYEHLGDTARAIEEYYANHPEETAQGLEEPNWEDEMDIEENELFNDVNPAEVLTAEIKEGEPSSPEQQEIFAILDDYKDIQYTDIKQLNKTNLIQHTIHLLNATLIA